MKILISYFYQIRNFKRNFIPISTAAWPPKYFKQNGHQFKDKNGVWNGIEAEDFVPGLKLAGLCRGPKCCQNIGSYCDFLQAYRKQLDNLNFESIMKRFEKLGQKVKDFEGFEEEPICVLIVFETPKNPCSERRPLQEWFEYNGYILEEFDKSKI